MLTQKEIERFWDKTLENELTGCMEWTASLDSYGYGQFSRPRGSKQRTVKAHRWAYEQCYGEIEAGLVLDHLCRNRSCVNPDHLEPVTHRENCRRAAKTHCSRGHEYSKENTYIAPDGKRRNCRACGAENAKKYRTGSKPIPCGRDHAELEP